MAEYKHGSMPTREQEKTYEGFIRVSTKFAIGVLVFLLLLAMWNG